LADKEFTGYFSRAVMLAAVIGLAPVLRWLRVSWRQVLGDVPLSIGWKQVLASFALAVLLIGVMGLLCGALGGVRIKPDADWTHLAKPLLSGVTVGIMEEFLFR